MAVISRIGIVQSCKDQVVGLRFDESGGCEGCAKGGGCSLGRLSGRYQQIASDLMARPGDRLLLRIDTKALVKAALLGYFLPGTMLVAGAAIAGYVTRFSDDLASLAGAIIGLVLGGVLLRLYDARHESRLWQVEPDLRDSGAEMR